MVKPVVLKKTYHLMLSKSSYQICNSFPLIFQGHLPDRSAILVESQAVQESLELANGMSLVYHSARTKGYLSTIQLQLTPSKIPTTLVKVHIKITIEGVVHEKVFEADPNIRYTYAWDRLNEYRQVRISFLVYA